MNKVAAFAWLALLGFISPAFSQTADPEKSAAEMITPASQQAIDRGLEWLASRQNDDGGFGSGAVRGNAAISALCGMAFMSGGSTPGRGSHGIRVQKTIDYLLAAAQPSGCIAEANVSGRGPMYSHGFATLFLAECYGMSHRDTLREKLAEAVKLIINSQNKEGGWRYFPKKDDADISVTVCQVMALRAAHNAGIFVPHETVERAVDYVKKCQNADGGFMYQLAAGGGESRFPRSAAAIVALNSAGIYRGAEVAKALDYLDQSLPQPGVVRRDENYEYGQYYAVQAMWHAGGKHWARWYPAIREELIAAQRTDGSWTSPSWGAEYATAMSLIILQMPENQLPIFQR